VKFSAIVDNSFCYKRLNFGTYISIGCRENAFLGHLVYVYNTVNTTKQHLTLLALLQLWV